MIKNFKFEKNQTLWNEFHNEFINNFKGKGKSTMSVNQYKPILLYLESVSNCEFSKLKLSEINSVIKSKPERTSHLKSALIQMILSGNLKVDKELILDLIPEPYNQLAKIYAKNKINE